MDLSVGMHVPWVGLGIGAVLALSSLWIAAASVSRHLRANDDSLSDFGPAYVIAGLLGMVLVAGAVGIDMLMWHSEGDGPVGTLRGEASRVYGLELSSEDAGALSDGEVILVETDDGVVVVRLQGSELVTVGDWVPLSK